MRKWISFLLTLTFVLVLAVPAFAEASSIKVEMTSTQGTPGGTVKVEIRVTNPGQPLAGIQLKVKVPEALTFESSDFNPAFALSDFVDGTLYATGTDDIAGYAGTDWVLATLTYKVADNAQIGELKASATCELAYNGDLKTDYTFEDASFTVQITDVMLGDVNADGKVDGRDAMRVAQYAAQYITLDGRALAAGDVTHDGKVDGRDAMRIAQSAAGLYTIQ